MNCKNCRNDLIGYLRGALSQGTEIRIREHLSVCAECRSFADYLRETLQVIALEKVISPDPFLATRIEGILTAPATIPPRLSFIARLIPAMVFTVLITAGAGGGIAIGKLIAPPVPADQLARNELTIFIDDIQQEPIEAFIMGLNETSEN